MELTTHAKEVRLSDNIDPAENQGESIDNVIIFLSLAHEPHPNYFDTRAGQREEGGESEQHINCFVTNGVIATPAIEDGEARV